MTITISGDGDINATGNDIELNSTGTTDVTLALGGGSVGIGTATPTKLLDVNGSVAVTDITPSSGIYLGGTGSANLLDDVETGSWTPVDNSPAGLTFSSVSGATYVKVGNLIRVSASITYPTTSDTNRVTIAGFPVSSASGSTNGGFVHYTNNGTTPNLNMGASSTSLSCYTASGGMFSNATMSGKRIDFTMIYQTA